MEGTGDSSANTDDTPPGRARPRPKKLYHKKSKTGCATCRSRRVKCFYDRIKIVVGVSQGEQNQDKIRGTTTDLLSPLVTSRPSKHLLELRLIHHFATQTADTLPTSADPNLAKVWREKCPELALKHPALLDTICAAAALHIALTEPSSDLFDAHCHCMDSALRGHRRDISNVNIINADAVWFTSSLLRIILFARLQDRNTELYQLPEELLSVTATIKPGGREYFSDGLVPRSNIGAMVEPWHQ
ncbi:C6 finger domain protein [Talaromyces stipitatus ATCC 10500]|uniref:C6 finger domain protein n=1 Tax=Talaromyces stipitatus (strain ATCC 10500 / CBS 375.48 / QM 6759 / NRRL 1006) TaxID=441959 RepID=B8LUN4_TALSN|nr:C6 finger domain protein [Talaromyces stipitatus ATCC 10500]EED23891.1 C6 finger domain protein [Talaromyces stipitatus ATCC 10500]